MFKKTITFSLFVWSLMGSAELWAVPYQCVGVKAASGGDQQNLAPFLKQQNTQLTDDGTVLDLIRYSVGLSGTATDIIPEADKLLASLIGCVDWIKTAGSPEDKEKLPAIYFAQVLAAQSVLLQARSSGDSAGMRHAARQLEKAAEQREATSPGLSITDSNRLKTAKDLATQIVDVESVRGDADVVVAVRNTLNTFLRPGAPQGDVFYSYLQQVNEPIYLAMKLLTDAAIAKERALALMERVLGTGKPPNEPGAAVCDAYDCSQLTEYEQTQLGQAYKTWQDTTGKAAPTHSKSSYTLLLEMRKAYKEAEAKKNIDNPHPPCFYKPDKNIPVKPGCIATTVIGTGNGSALSPWDSSYTYEGLPDSLQQSLLQLVPLIGMDADVKHVAELLVVDSDVLALQKKYELPAKTLLNTLDAWPDERFPLPLISAGSGDTLTLGLEPTVLETFGLTGGDGLKEISFVPSQDDRESRLSFSLAEVCMAGDKLREFEGLLHKPLQTLREELDDLLSSEGFDKACAAVSTYIQPTTTGSSEPSGSGG